MVGGPPDGAALNRRGTKQAHEKLDWAARTKCLVAEVTMVKAGNRKHANDVHPKAQAQGGP